VLARPPRGPPRIKPAQPPATSRIPAGESKPRPPSRRFGLSQGIGLLYAVAHGNPLSQLRENKLIPTQTPMPWPSPPDKQPHVRDVRAWWGPHPASHHTHRMLRRSLFRGKERHFHQGNDAVLLDLINGGKGGSLIGGVILCVSS
jgi:hypothetical protein